MNIVSRFPVAAAIGAWLILLLFALEGSVRGQGIGPPPRFTQQPASQIVAAGSTVAFTATATSVNTAVRYQWLIGGAILGGSTNSTLTLTNVTSRHAGT